MQEVPPPDRPAIRPAVWLVAIFMVASVSVAVWALSGADSASAGDDPELAQQGSHGRESHRRRGWGSPGHGATTWGTGPADAGAAADDPQVAAYERSWQRFGDAGAGVGPEFSPTTHLGVLRSVEGAAPVAPGARCEVRLLPVLSSLFNCVVRVACDDVVLYPDEAQQAGYAPCDVQGGVALGATDTGSTHEDGDPALDVDVRRRQVRVGDEGPGVAPFSAEIGLLRPI